MARLEAQIRQLAARRGELARELERMGVDRARLLADNIELDQKAGRLAEETAAAAGCGGDVRGLRKPGGRVGSGGSGGIAEESAD